MLIKELLRQTRTRIITFLFISLFFIANIIIANRRKFELTDQTKSKLGTHETNEQRRGCVDANQSKLLASQVKKITVEFPANTRAILGDCTVVYELLLLLFSFYFTNTFIEWTNYWSYSVWLFISGWHLFTLWIKWQLTLCNFQSTPMKYPQCCYTICK